ncbi:hypothetical protein [Desulfobacter hydrogenophilus]|uniref:hypothetical protein n=1 Tax=Desulfobacter hydrogenophilus TaxID=2291 RepID=UPI001A941F23|nr:hypothetical protein [Desulfobacter hydrogenophilus]
MSYPMMGLGMDFIDDFFEAIFGVTTTGLSTKATLVIQPGLVAKGLAATAAETDDLVGGTRAYAQRALKV